VRPVVQRWERVTPFHRILPLAQEQDSEMYLSCSGKEEVAAKCGAVRAVARDGGGGGTYDRG
jgi:hypothetical protein